MLIGPLFLVMIAVAVLVFRLATLAALVLVGVGLGVLAYRTGAGALGGAVVGIACAVAAFGLVRWLAAPGRPTWQRLTAALAFAAPAAACGYFLAHGLIEGATPSPVWRAALAVFGALVVGASAFAKIYDPAAGASRFFGRSAA
jgi:hypothetical protein